MGPVICVFFEIGQSRLRIVAEKDMRKDMTLIKTTGACFEAGPGLILAK
jgi:hypothetical protein